MHDLLYMAQFPRDKAAKGQHREGFVIIGFDKLPEINI